MRFMSDDVRAALDAIERASEDRHIISFDYTDGNGTETKRRINPLGLWIWTHAWTTVGWCHQRDDFRMFRIDRMRALTVEDERFSVKSGQTLRDFYDQLREREGLPADFDMQTIGF
jgi:predicted DNA-binding transcriptional regulator YafY